MAFLPVYAVDGGSVPGEMLRRVAWVLSAGESGVSLPGDLKARELSVPAGKVRVMPGGGLIAGGYADGQTYAVYNSAADGDAIIDVPPTGSGGGRTDYLIFRVEDPQYGGQVPANPEDATYGYLDLVSSLSGLTYPALPLARIDIPASTATITDSMITDLREVSSALSKKYLRTFALTVADGDDVLSATNREHWPDKLWTKQAWGTFYIPEWANRARLSIIVSGIKAPSPGGAWGRLWIQMGPLNGDYFETQGVSYSTANSSQDQRPTFMTAAEHWVPKAMRGNSYGIALVGNYSGSGNSERLIADNFTTLTLNAEFYASAE